MPRSAPTDGFDRYDSDEPAFQKFRSARTRRSGPRLVKEGKSGSTSVEELLAFDGGQEQRLADEPDLSTFSSYDVATHGPDPIPDWVVTSFSALDTPLGILKTGKEADVHLLDRSLPDGPGSLLAVKIYRSSEHRMFHRDSGYLEGRRVRRTRETRAMATRTAFGRELLAGKWAFAEFEALSKLWSAGAAVPYPVQLIGSELMMQFIGSPDGSAAPRLAAVTPEGDPTEYFTHLWWDLTATLAQLADLGFTHGDLSAYNVLVQDHHCVLIDLPQVVDVVANPRGAVFLARDAANIAGFFQRRGVDIADADLLLSELADRAGL